MRARAIQENRFKNSEGIYCNAQMTTRQMHAYVRPDNAGLTKLQTAMQRLNLSARAYDRILKVSRTIADLENTEHVSAQHISEAINYRSLDREGWGA